MLRNVLLLLVSLSITLLALEGGLRVLHPQPLDAKIQDDVLGWKNHPKDTFTTSRGNEFNVEVHYNEQGFHDKPFKLEKDPDTFRIAMVGDSFTESAEVAFAEGITRRLEAELKKRRYNIEVMNFGVKGYGSGQELILLEQHILPYQPDLVVWQFCLNDLTNNICSSPYQLRHGQLILDPQFVTKKSGWKVMGSWLRSRSHTYVFLHDRLLSMLAQLTGKPFNQETPYCAQLYLDGKMGPVDPNAKSMNPTIREGWQLTKAIFTRGKEKLDASKISLVSFTIPARFQIKQEEWPELITKYQVDPSQHDPDLVANRFVATMQEIGVPTLDLVPLMRQDYAHGMDLYYKIDGHWRPLGHLRAAQHLADFLERKNLLPSH